ncbi:MAG: hypothetical protein NTZ08_12820, partial [Verrucomicrobia bacterium]|nr:hypothetical protein [Verrucomicrobiota bacterium]
PAPGELRASPFRGRLRSARYARLRSAAPGRGAQIAKNQITEQTLHRQLSPGERRELFLQVLSLEPEEDELSICDHVASEGFAILDEMETRQQG